MNAPTTAWDVAFIWVWIEWDGIAFRPKQGLVCVVVRDDLALRCPQVDVVQVGLCQLQVGEGDGIAFNVDVPFVSDVFQYSNLAHGLEYAGVASFMRRFFLNRLTLFFQGVQEKV